MPIIILLLLVEVKLNLRRFQQNLNHFIAPACTVSGLKKCIDSNGNVFWSYNTCTFKALRFDENPFTCQCENEIKKAEGFQISHFHWSFSSDIMAVMGLNVVQSSSDLGHF